MKMPWNCVWTLGTWNPKHSGRMASTLSWAPFTKNPKFLLSLSYIPYNFVVSFHKSRNS